MMCAASDMKMVSSTLHVSLRGVEETLLPRISACNGQWALAMTKKHITFPLNTCENNPAV